MRIVIAVAIVVLGSITTASAQFAMDHGHSSDAARAASEMAIRRIEAATKEINRSRARIANSAGLPSPLLPSESTDFSVNGSAVIRAEPTRTPEQQKADAEAQSTWQARCRPTVVEDSEGLRRIKYAEKDCDLSNFNTAGTP
jgi:hypothetical protein